MRNAFKIILIASIVFSFLACASKEEVDPIKELFKEDKSLIPINTKELKEVK